MEFRGQLGLSDVAKAPVAPAIVGRETTALIDAHAPKHCMATILVRAVPASGGDSAAPPAGSVVACVAELQVGGESTGQVIRFDTMNGVAITIGGKRWRLVVRNHGTIDMRVSASILPGGRPAARELQLTDFGAAIAASQSASFPVPSFAAWLEVYRALEEQTEFAVDFGTPLNAAVYTLYALQGERLPRMAIANGITRVMIRNPLEDAGNQTITPTLIWGLWL